MKKSTTITINGRLYDAVTGMPVTNEVKLAENKPAKAQAQSHAKSLAAQKTFTDIGPHTRTSARKSHNPDANVVHQTPQRSQTLNRQAIKKPDTKKHTEPTRSPLITRFGPNVIQPQDAPAPQQTQQSPQYQAPTPQPPTPPNTTPLHPTVVKVMQQREANKLPAHQTSKELKEVLIKERLAEVSDRPKKAKKNFFARRPKLAGILASSLSLLILAGYFTYANLTNISMRVAANRAGINASVPAYKPDGFGLSGPITYSPGEVNVNYKSNTNEKGFTLTQKATPWDSQAVLDNYVRKQTSTYLTFQEQGITVYTFNNKAAWTNGGLLYTIDGDASLSSDQILRLATSL